MQQLWAVKEKIKYTGDQFILTLDQLEKVAQELEKVEDIIKNCETNEKETESKF